MTTTPARRTTGCEARPAAGRAIVALATIITVIAAGIISLLAVPASASPIAGAQNAVGVIGNVGGQRIGPHEQILAGQGWARAPGYDLSASGSGVGAEGDTAVDLYHGTSAENAASIRANGIDLGASRTNLDFGPGFYTTPDVAQAARLAAQRFGDSAEVLHFRVPSSALDQLNSLTFADTGPAWQEFVSANRAAGSLSGYDFVQGPVLANPGALLEGGTLRGFGWQAAFQSQEGIDTLYSGLQP